MLGILTLIVILGLIAPTSGAQGRVGPARPEGPGPAAIAAARAGSVGAGSVSLAAAPEPGRSVTRWSWPIRPRPAVARRFDAPAGPYAAGHRGLDLQAGAGAPVLAVDTGVVSHVGVVAGRGTLTMQHDSGLFSTYEPVDASVGRGRRVTRGAVVGRVGTGGHCTGCLHLGASRGPPRDRAYVDPWPLLVAGPVILLPLR